MAQRRKFLFDAFAFFAGCVITFGFWFSSDIAQWFESRDVAPAVEPFTEPVVRAPAVSPRAADPAPAPRPQDDNRVEVLARMAQTCAFWSARDDDESGRIYRNRACKAMREYAQRSRQAVPSIRPFPAPQPQERAPATARTPVGVFIRECTNLARGSINYRECRADEKQRLKERCQYHRQREEWRHAGEWCSAAENYHIVD